MKLFFANKMSKKLIFAHGEMHNFFGLKEIYQHNFLHEHDVVSKVLKIL